MYLDYFSLERHPFRITPDPSLFFPGGQDGRGVILNALIYGIQSGEGILKVVGEVGSGKTMLCRMLEEELPDHVEIVYIANPSLSAREILYAIAIELKLDVNSSTERLKVLHMIQAYLLKKHAEGGAVVVFVEEAQSMPLETLEEIRLLNNLETHEHKLMQIVLFGQPELDKILAQKNIRQLRERITHSFRLEPLSAEATSEYIRYRLQAAGSPRDQLFSSRAEKMIAKASSGLTRRINILADKSLLAAYADSPSRQPPQTGNKPLVLPRHVSAAIKDSDYKNPGFSPWLFGTVSFSAAVMLSAYILFSEFWPNPLQQFSEGQPGNQISDPQTITVAEGATVAVNTTVTNNLQNERVMSASTEDPSNNARAPAENSPVSQSGEIVEGIILREPLRVETELTALISEQAPDEINPPLENTDSVIPLDAEPQSPTVDAQVTVAAAETVALNSTPATAAAVVSDTNTTAPVPVSAVNEPEEALENTASVEAGASTTATNNTVAINDSDRSETAPVRVDRETLPVIVISPQATQELPKPELIPQSPVAIVSSGLAESRMQPTADWLRALEEKNGYTIQLFSVPSTNPNGLEEYLQFLQLVSLLEDTYICFMPISSETSGRWQVMHQEFEGVTLARQFINSLPVYIRQYDPYVRNLQGVQCSYPVERGRGQ